MKIWLRSRWNSTSNRLPARAMVYTVFIITLIATLTGGIVLVSEHSRTLQLIDFQKSRLIYNLESATQLAFALPPVQRLDTVLDLFGTGNDSIQIQKTNWGVFPLVKISAWVHTGDFVDSAQQAFTLGYPLQNSLASALVCPYSLAAVSVCGRTLIRGDAHLSHQGIKMGYILNRHFEYQDLVVGNIHKTPNPLPKTSDTLLMQLDFMQMLPSSSHAWSDSMEVSFAQPTHVIRGTHLRIPAVAWSGNMVLIADSSITFSAQARCKNIVAFAPQITIESGFDGNLQAFASTYFNIKPDVFLRYPSVVALLENTHQQAVLQIDSFAQIDGLVWAHNNTNKLAVPSVVLAPKSVVRGQVFAEGALQMQGIVFGNVSCELFQLKLPAVNHSGILLDATLDYHKLPPFYLSPPFVNVFTQQPNIVSYLPCD